MKCCAAVFAGPSLTSANRVAHPAIEYLPPAARGDVAQAATRYASVLLIDGVFHNDVAPSPKEVYEASRTAAVYGAASMGALRAAECAAYGVTPLGIIARWYLREVLTGDDEVALLFDPSTQRALTVPSVNVRYLAWMARRKSIFDHRTAEEFVSRARAIYYMDRDWHEVLAVAAPALRTKLAALIPAADLKQHDALFALRRLIRSLS